MTKLAGRSARSVMVCVTVALVIGCWPRTREEALDRGYHPETVVDGYEHAVDKATEWSPTSFLEGASASYSWQDNRWRPYRLSYVFVDAQQRESMLIVIRLETRVAELNPAVPIEHSQVSTLPFLLPENPVGEREALGIADSALGNDVVLKCSSPEAALRGDGFGDNQYWALTYTAHEPMWRVVGEVSVDAKTGEVVFVRDLTHHCQE